MCLAWEWSSYGHRVILVTAGKLYRFDWGPETRDPQVTLWSCWLSFRQCYETASAIALVAASSITGMGAGFPVHSSKDAAP